MKVYLASSWRNQHAVEMLTTLLRQRGHEVLSFVENNFDEGHTPGEPFDFEHWVGSERADKCFEYDTTGAATADAFVYIGPSGVDAWAEVGIAYASCVPLVGLWAKGEQAGLMRRLIAKWCNRYNEVLDYLDSMNVKASHNL